MKITHQLGLAGFIETVRGKGGGMRLARAPGEINLGAVVRSVEPDFNLVECLATGNTCTLTGQCRLTAIVSGALRQFLDHLDGHTLADVLPAHGDGPAQARTMKLQPRRRRPAVSESGK